MGSSIYYVINFKAISILMTPSSSNVAMLSRLTTPLPVIINEATLFAMKNIHMTRLIPMLKGIRFLVSALFFAQPSIFARLVAIVVSVCFYLHFVPYCIPQPDLHLNTHPRDVTTEYEQREVSRPHSKSSRTLKQKLFCGVLCQVMDGKFPQISIYYIFSLSSISSWNLLHCTICG